MRAAPTIFQNINQFVLLPLDCLSFEGSRYSIWIHVAPWSSKAVDSQKAEEERMDLDTEALLWWQVCEAAVASMPPESALAAVEERLGREIRRGCRQYNHKTPEVIVIAHEYDARSAHL